MATIRGSWWRDDLLTGTAGDDVFYGYAGNDVFRSSAGDDAYYGGLGTDTVHYGAASSGVSVNLQTGSGNDGSGGIETYYSIENVTGSSYDDFLTGNGQSNTLRGGSGDDNLEGGGGADILNGGANNSWGDSARYDTASSGVHVDLLDPGNNTGAAAGDSYISIENLYGSDHDDTLLGDGGANVVNGRGDDDIINGRGGNDDLMGEGGSDTFVLDHLGQSDEHDVIWDFESGVDQIDLSGTQVSSFADLGNAFGLGFLGGDYMEQVGSDVVIHTSSDTSVTLLDVELSSLTASDFLF